MQLIVTIFSAVASLLLALFVLLRNRASGTNVYFGILVIFLGLYTVFNHLALNAPTSDEVFIWAKMILFASIPAGPLFYSFVKVFPDSTFVFNKKLQVLILFWTIANLVLAHSNLIFASVSIDDGSLQITPGLLVPSFVLLQFTGIIGGAITLIKKYKKAKGKLKLQLQYITFGILTSFGLTLLATVVFPIIFQQTFLLVISPLFLLFGEVMIAFTIVRHKLFDIRLALARAVSFTLLTLVLVLVYTSILFLFSRSLFEDVVGSAAIFALTGLNMIMVFAFQPMNRLFTRVTDRVFYKDRYNAPKLLRDLADIMASTIDLEEMLKKLLQVLMREMKVSKSAFILFEDGKIYQTSVRGYLKKPEFDSSEIEKLMTKKQVRIYESLDDERCKTIYDKYNFSLAVRLATDENELGILAFGQKLSGEVYSQADMQLISILAPQIAVAVENSKSYEEIKRFNITLKEEVNDATQNLKKANDKLKELDKLKDEFISITSHELRTPMTAIKSYLWMVMAGKGGKTTAKQRYYLERSFTATERLIKLVNDMLNISRIEAGRIVLEVSKFSMLEVARIVQDEVKHRADELDLTVNIETQGDEQSDSFLVVGDESKVIEVLINLVGNSLKFTPAKGTITINIFREAGFVVTEVVDTGTGIDPNKITNLFQKFGMIKDSYQTNQEAANGAGLGLFICKSIIKMHKGEIWAKSEGLGHGSTFGFSLMRATPKNFADLARGNKKKSEVDIIPSGLWQLPSKK